MLFADSYIAWQHYVYSVAADEGTYRVCVCKAWCDEEPPNYRSSTGGQSLRGFYFDAGTVTWAGIVLMFILLSASPSGHHLRRYGVRGQTTDDHDNMLRALPDPEYTYLSIPTSIV